MVVQDIPVDKTGIPSGLDQSAWFSSDHEYPHVTMGAGLKLAYNENFVISADLGFPIDKRDGSYGIYIGFGFLFWDSMFFYHIERKLCTTCITHHSCGCYFCFTIWTI